MERLDKILSEYSRYSRREASELIRRGRVLADGVPVRDAAAKFDPETVRLTVDGTALVIRKQHTLMLNKPAGYVSATDDPREKTVLELVREEDRYPELFPAGRLDKDTTGLLILTSDGDLCHRIISPKKEIWKTYETDVQGLLTKADADAVRAGIRLQSGEQFLPGELTVLEAGEVSRAELKIREGKFHQVKRMMAALGKPVLHLRRTAVGGLRLDPLLAPGEYRTLTEQDIDRIFLG
ncbi:MAG: rRNA pseudouridine synthase [Lachnospiraceae bacterium]|nr:rRNA pseudouridine synthase [Lachnospiraceae bacterium]